MVEWVCGYFEAGKVTKIKNEVCPKVSVSLETGKAANSQSNSMGK